MLKFIKNLPVEKIFWWAILLKIFVQVEYLVGVFYLIHLKSAHSFGPHYDATINYVATLAKAELAVDFPFYLVFTTLFTRLFLKSKDENGLEVVVNNNIASPLKSSCGLCDIVRCSCKKRSRAKVYRSYHDLETVAYKLKNELKSLPVDCPEWKVKYQDLQEVSDQMQEIRDRLAL